MKRKALCPILGVLAFAATATCAADVTIDERPARIDGVLAAAAERGASGVLRVTREGSLYYEAGFGSASCTADEPVTPQHVFMIGSITKTLTRVLAYVLVERGHFSLDDRLGDLLPDLRGPLGAATVYQVIQHTGGLPDLIDATGSPVPYSIAYDYEPVTKAQLLERASLAEPIGEPGGTEVYSNLGYQLLAAMYEERTGQSYPELLRRHVYEPAGMTGTGYGFDDAASREFADGCSRGGAHWGNPVDDRMWGPEGPSWNLAGAGGLLSTAESLARFFDGIGTGVYFRSEAQAERFKEERMTFSERRDQRIMGPAGSNGIFNAVAFWADRDRLSVILITNRADHLAEAGLFREVLALFPPERQQ